MIKKFEDTFSKLKELEDSMNDNNEKFWKSLEEEIKMPLYLVEKDSKLF